MPSHFQMEYLTHTVVTTFLRRLLVAFSQYCFEASWRLFDEFITQRSWSHWLSNGFAYDDSSSKVWNSGNFDSKTHPILIINCLETKQGPWWCITEGLMCAKWNKTLAAGLQQNDIFMRSLTALRDASRQTFYNKHELIFHHKKLGMAVCCLRQG